MTEQIANVAESTLSASVDSAATSLHPVSVVGFPSTGTFRVRLGPLTSPLSDCELVLVESVASGIWTVQRGAEGTTAKAWASNTPVALILTAGGLEALLADLDEELEADLDALAADLTTEIGNRASAVTAEANARSAADTALDARVDAAEGALETAEGEIADSIDTVQSQSIERDDALGVRIDGEATARSNADAAEETRAKTAEALALLKSGGTMGGALILHEDPTTSLGAATKQYVLAQITALINGAPGTLDTLKEIADALGSEETAVLALTGVVAGKLAASANLSDLANAAEARAHLSVPSIAKLETEEAARKAGDEAEEMARKNADSTLTTAVAAKAATSALTTETTEREAKDKAEREAREAADVTLTTAVTAEEKRAKEAEGTKLAAATYYETHTFLIGDTIAVPSGDTNFIPPMRLKLRSGTQTAKISKVEYRCNNAAAGTTFTFKLQKNGEDITGFTGIKTPTSVKWEETDPTDVALADGDSLAVVVTAIEGTPKNGSVTMVIEHTVTG